MGMDELDPIEAAVEAIRRGEMIIVVDDDDRENEGDLIMAAVTATPEQVAFMVRHTSGILCTPVTSADAARLRLTPMVSVNDAPLQTAFTVSVDYRFGLTTGISAEERTSTIRALANRNIGAEDFVRPGHIFPLVARDGGVLVRSGHTEAAVDLCRLAGVETVGVLAELVNDDGTVKRLPACREFAAAHGLRIVAIADLIEYRQRRDQHLDRLIGNLILQAQYPQCQFTRIHHLLFRTEQSHNAFCTQEHEHRQTQQECQVKRRAFPNGRLRTLRLAGTQVLPDQCRRRIG